MSSVRLNRKMRKMAELYVKGPPGVRGHWAESARQAGYTKIPKRAHPQINMLIEQMSGKRPTTSPPNTVDKALASVKMPAADASPEDWHALGLRLLPIWRDIAAGTVDANSTQRQVLQDIMNRAFGKPGAGDANNQAELGVVLLPVIGRDGESRICPRCKLTLEEAKKAQ